MEKQEVTKEKGSMFDCLVLVIVNGSNQLGLRRIKRDPDKDRTTSRQAEGSIGKSKED